MIYRFKPSTKDLIDPDIKQDYDITLNLYPACNMGKVQTNCPFFYSFKASK